MLNLVESADLRGFEAPNSGRGSAAYPPAIMLALLLYGYVKDTFSTRKLEEPGQSSLPIPVQQPLSGPFDDQLIPEAVQKRDQVHWETLIKGLR